MGTTISLAATRPIVVTLNGVNMITKLKDCRKLYLANLSHGILTRYTWETFKVIVWRNFDIKSSLIQGEYPSRMRCHRQSMHTCLPQSPRTLQSIRHQLCHVTVQETPIPPAICVVNYRFHSCITCGRLVFQLLCCRREQPYPFSRMTTAMAAPPPVFASFRTSGAFRTLVCAKWSEIDVGKLVRYTRTIMGCSIE
ncbi:hypothetical protein, variant 1 [Aphanomyces astaci]|uniref:Uncharacterized protein n=1 Tax=Aphanomyces astaci TaxID=112090 RepID=W4GCZ6_APHAT|nr:hypothetical protein, variant 1 [Aphanomyces astaci]ETV77542.1 hypothetical protein, variant 1 [Aphanomyces astaci]|eukprot:XP_009832652.1 hypothetical protein, variant 1 [Aphanomyces astaci]